MDSYIQELLDTLNATQIWQGTSKKAASYHIGIELLVEQFFSHKAAQAGAFFIGNGGSCAIASHMAADFMKNGEMNACSLCDHAVMTCMGNDYGYEYVYAKPLEFLAKPGDLLVAVSSSGNSANIVKAVETAKSKGADVITFTGFLPDNRVKQMGDYNVYVPCEKYGIVESIHNLILQQAVDCMKQRMEA